MELCGHSLQSALPVVLCLGFGVARASDQVSHKHKMPVDSTPSRGSTFPQVDIWTFLFDRKDREYPGDKGLSSLSSIDPV